MGGWMHSDCFSEVIIGGEVGVNDYIDMNFSKLEFFCNITGRVAYQGESGDAVFQNNIACSIDFAYVDCNTNIATGFVGAMGALREMAVELGDFVFDRIDIFIDVLATKPSGEQFFPTGHGYVRVWGQNPDEFDAHLLSGGMNAQVHGDSGNDILDLWFSFSRAMTTPDAVIESLGQDLDIALLDTLYFDDCPVIA